VSRRSKKESTASVVKASRAKDIAAIAKSQIFLENAERLWEKLLGKLEHKRRRGLGDKKESPSRVPLTGNRGEGKGKPRREGERELRREHGKGLFSKGTSSRRRRSGNNLV